MAVRRSIGKLWKDFGDNVSEFLAGNSNGESSQGFSDIPQFIPQRSQNTTTTSSQAQCPVSTSDISTDFITQQNPPENEGYFSQSICLNQSNTSISTPTISQKSNTTRIPSISADNDLNSFSKYNVEKSQNFELNNNKEDATDESTFVPPSAIHPTIHQYSENGSLTYTSPTNSSSKFSMKENCQSINSLPTTVSSPSCSPWPHTKIINIEDNPYMPPPSVEPETAVTDFNECKFRTKGFKNFYNKSFPALLCVFCHNYGHISHRCHQFRSKEEYWLKVLSERRCKNCLRSFHKSDTCYYASFCRNFGCRRKDKHSPVLCKSNYFYFNDFPSIFHLPYEGKPPPLMSLKFSSMQENCNKGLPKTKTLKEVKNFEIRPFKTTIDASTQTYFSHDVVLNKSQFTQTDFVPIADLNLIISPKEQTVNSNLNLPKRKKRESPESILSNSNLDKLFYSEIPLRSTEQVFSRQEKNGKNSVFQKKPETMSFSDMMLCKNSNLDSKTPVPYWLNPKNPEVFRALNYLRYLAANKKESEFEIDVVNSAIMCVELYIKKARPDPAALYRNELNKVLRNLPVSR